MIASIIFSSTTPIAYSIEIPLFSTILVDNSLPIVLSPKADGILAIAPAKLILQELAPDCMVALSSNRSDIMLYFLR